MKPEVGPARRGGSHDQRPASAETIKRKNGGCHGLEALLKKSPISSGG